MPRCHASRTVRVLWLGAAASLLLSTATAATTADRFKLALLPDTQHYSQMEPGPSNPFFAQTQWIKDNATTANIKFAIHLGDIVEDKNNVESEWVVASQAMSILETGSPVVPYSIAPGNHDMHGSGSPLYLRDYSMYNEYFPVSRFSGTPWYGGHYGSNNANNVNYFSVGDLDFMVLALEILPRDSVLDWADGLIKSHPNHRVIVETHRYLRPDGTRYTEDTDHGVTGNSGQHVFEELVYPNPNVFMVVCGHVTEVGFNVATNQAGGQVFEILTDYQNIDDGGMRVLDFVPAANRIDVRSYSPVTGQWNRNGWYSLDYDMGGTPSAPTPATLLGHWTFDDGVGNPSATTAVDSTGNGPPAVLQNFGAPPAWQTGTLGGALRFDGTNDRVTTGTPVELLPEGALSISLWINKLGRPRGEYGAMVCVEEAGETDNDAFMLAVDSATSKLKLSIQQSDLSYDQVTLTGNTAIGNTDGWRHVAAVFQPGWRMAIYLDGVLDAELTTGVPYDVNTLTDALLTIGNLNAAGGVNIDCFNGLIDQVRFYSGCLSQSQITQLAAEHDLIPGDANDDGVVDQEDAESMAGHWGNDHATWEMGDFDRDGVVGAGDAAILAANWGRASAESAAAPEPASTALLTCLVAVVGLASRRHGRYRA